MAPAENSCHGGAVQLLNEAIATVLGEVERGFVSRRNAGGTGLAVERIRITMNFSLEDEGQIAHAEPEGRHSVTVEFKVGEAGALLPVVERAAPKVQAPAEGEIIPTLSQVFGAPGFDSSARATVFRETFAERSHEQACAAVAGLGSASSVVSDEAVRFASQMLRGIIQSGPAKTPARGAELLQSVLSRHPLNEVLRVVQVIWKTQDDWM